MSEDTKLDFYLKNRAQIEEWAALRAPALTALEEAFAAGAEQLAEDPSLPPLGKVGPSTLFLPIVDAPLPLARVEFNWNRNGIFKGSGRWPNVVLVVDPTYPKPLRQELVQATAFTSEALGLVKTMATQWWLRCGAVTPAEDPIEIESYAALCIERFRDTWEAVHETVVGVLRNYQTPD